MSTPTTSITQLELDNAETPRDDSIGAAINDYLARIRRGDVGSLPAILGLLALLLVFTALRPSTFTNAFNFANLINQGAGVIVIAMGLIFVLLLGEIDLSAGYTAGTAAAMMGIAVTREGWPWWAGLIVCLGTGAVIGTFIGIMVSRLGIPSFVVTLALFLGLQGVLLWLIGEGGTIGIRDETLLAIMNKNMPVWLGWAFFAVGMALYGFFSYRKVATQRAQGLHGASVQVWAAKYLVMVLILGLTTYYLSIERSRNPAENSIKGVPIVVAVLVVLLVGLSWLLGRTQFGRHVYAVGGNQEAARRAGINVRNVKLACFVLCSTIAAIAGILIASRDNSISPTTGGASTLLYAVGAAVIGGTSLFGGKGRIADAVIGGLVVAVIANGMALLGLGAAIVYMVTGLVLLVAASVDAISRRKAMAT